MILQMLKLIKNIILADLLPVATIGEVDVFDKFTDEICYGCGNDEEYCTCNHDEEEY